MYLFESNGQEFCVMQITITLHRQPQLPAAIHKIQILTDEMKLAQ
jgi:hypothetical protein